MAKVVFLTLEGNFEAGFVATVEIREDDLQNSQLIVGKTGTLPKNLELKKNLDNWQWCYREFISPTSALGNSPVWSDEDDEDRNDAFEGCRVAAEELRNSFNSWLNAEGFRDIERVLNTNLSKSEPIRIVLQTNNRDFPKMPWHEWALVKQLTKAEVAISSPNFKSSNNGVKREIKEKVKILVILGLEGEVKEAAEEIKKLGNKIEVTWLVQPKITDLDEPLWKQKWDILFFVGHGATFEEGQVGKIQVNDQDWLAISDLKNHLNQAINNGLQLAIISACDGLGIAHQLLDGEDLYLPQAIVMRELLPVAVAPRFLQYFLEEYTSGLSLYVSLRQARQRLQILERDFPCASWLPVICQNPAVIPPTWVELGGIPACPYQGLAAFTEENKGLFFGREAFTEELIKAVGKKKLVAVIGASGSGKSSVVLAGLIPQLRKQGNWLIVKMRPESKPFENLAEAILLSLAQYKNNNSHALVKIDPNKVKDISSSLQNASKTLSSLVKRVLELAKNKQSFLLLIDQFEELYTVSSETESQLFIHCLIKTIKEISSFRLVLTLRADFVSEAIKNEAFRSELQRWKPEFIGVMGKEDLQIAIEKPAKCKGIKLEAGLTEYITSAVSKESGYLPLLQFALTQLWSKQKSGYLTRQAYDDIGGIESALRNHAQNIYDSLSKTDKKRTQRIFIQLVRPGEGTEDTKRLATRAEVGEENWDLVTRLASERLVVTNTKDEIDTVEIVHEVLISVWADLREWIEDNRAFRVWQERLKVAMHQWEISDKDDGALLRGVTLAEAENWLRQRSTEISASELVFIQTSLGLRDKEIKERDRQRRGIVLGLSGVLVVVSMFAGVATWQWKQAELERAKAERQRIDAELTAFSLSSENLFNSNKQLEALIEAIKAGKILQKAGTVKADTRMRVLLALQQAVYEIRERNRLEEPTSTPSGVSFSPNGKMIASTHYDVIKIWDRDGKSLRTIKLEGYSSGKWSFSPDSKMIVTSVRKTDYTKPSSSDTNELQIWSIDGVLQHTLKGYNEFTNKVIFSPNNQIIASASSDKTIKLWSLDGHLIHILKHANEAKNISFSPDGKIIASEDGQDIKLWNVENGKLIKVLKGHTHKIEWVSFSPDGKMIASYDDNDFKSNYVNLRIWKSDGRLIKSLKITNHYFSLPQFSPDSKSIAAFDTGSTMDINLWGLDGKLISTFKGNASIPVGLSFSPDGQFMATANMIGKIAVWNVNKISPTIIRTPKIRVNSISFSPDSKIIALANQDNKVRLWNRDSKSFQILQGHQHPVKGIAFSPVGDKIASISEGGDAIVWDYHGTALNRFDVTDYNIQYEDHNDVVTSVKFLPGQNKVASVSFDGTLRFWSLDGQYGTRLNASGIEFPIRDLSFSPDGKTFAFAIFGNGIYLFKDGQAKAEILTDNHKGSTINSISFSPDGKVLASASSDKTVKLWNLEGKVIQTFNHSNAVGSVSFSPDGQTIATISGDGIKLWNLSGKLLKQFDSRQIPDVESFGIGISYLELDKKTSYPVVTAIIDGTPVQKAGIKEGDQILKINGIDTKGKDLTDIKSLIKGKQGTQVSLKISRPYQPDFIISIIREWEETKATKVQFSPDGQIIAAINNDKIELWDKTGKLLKTLSGHTDAIFDINFSPNGKTLASASMDKTVKLWSIPEGKEIKTLNGHGAAVMSVNFSADNQFLVSAGADSIIRLWKADGTFIKPLLGKPRIQLNPIPNHVSFSQDGKMLALSGSTIVHGSLWTINGNLVKNLSYSWLKRFLPNGNLGLWQGVSNGHRDFVTSLIYSPDGKMFVSGSAPGEPDVEIKLWTEDGIFIRDLKGSKLSVNDLSFSPDSKIVASANLDNTLKLWSIDGTLLKTLTANNTPIYSVAFSPIFSSNNYILASGSGDKMGSDSINYTIQLWSNNGTLLKTLEGYNCGIIEGGQGCLSFSPDGKTLASVDDDSVILWNFDLDDLVIKGCDWVRGYLENNPNVSESDKHLCDSIGTTQ